MKKLMMTATAILMVLFLASCGTDDDEQSADADEKTVDETDYDMDKYDTDESDETYEDESYEDETVEEEPTEREKTIDDITDLMTEDEAFDTGTYQKGDIPEGEYVFITFEGSGSYYSEEEPNGSIIDNANFDSFGYVQVHEAGNITTDGALVSVDALDELDVSGAKELYEKVNGTEDYMESGIYKVGTDIDAGQYTIDSYGESYVAITTGAVGDDEIVMNDNFNGEKTVNVQEGQYLNVSGGQLKD